MKKILILIALTLVTLATLSGCAPKPVVTKVGTASVTSVQPRSATAEVAGRVRVNVTTATVMLDADGKFVSVNIDVAQNDGTFGVDGVIIKAEAAPTTKEKGAAYDMKKASEIGKEWFEQIASLEAWMIGKTLAEVKALPLTDGNVADSEDLRSEVSITVTDYLAAVEKAVAAAVELEDVAKVGAESVTSVQPRAVTADAAGRIRVNTTLVGVALDKDGKVLHVFIDVAQNDGTFGADGVIVKAEAAPTNKEKGDAYDMKKASEIGKEWYEQIASLEAWMIGKTLAEVKALPLTDGNVADSEDLRSEVSITVTDYLAAVEKAVAAAVELEDVAKVGAESVTSVQPRAVTADAAGRIRVNTTLVGVALDKDGKVLHVFIDVAQNDGTFGADGVIVKAEAAPTNKEKGDAYDMKKASEIGKEWYEQIASLEAWMLGKTLTEVKALTLTTEGDIAESEDLRSEVSVGVTDYLAAFEKAYNAAK